MFVDGRQGKKDSGFRFVYEEMHDVIVIESDDLMHRFHKSDRIRSSSSPHQ
jgi:hypothetical protein